MIFQIIFKLQFMTQGYSMISKQRDFRLYTTMSVEYQCFIKNALITDRFPGVIDTISIFFT